MESAQGDSPPAKFELSPRSKLYMNISENLSEDEVKSLRAMLVTDHYINKGKIENATPHEIFNMLEDDGKLGEGNLGLLKELLKGLGHQQLAKEAEDLEKEENMKLTSMSKRKATEDASSTKQKRMSSEGSDDSDSSAESGIGCPSSSSQNMDTDDFENDGDLATSADGSTMETVGDVRKQIEHLRTKIAKLTRYPNNISKTKSEEVSDACNEMGRLVKLLKEQSTGELKVDIALLNTQTQDEFQEKCETGRPHQKIGKEVKQIMRSNSDDIVNVKPEVKVESANFSSGRRATIRVTAEDVELADSCKLDKDSAVRQLFRYLVDNSQELRPITRYLNSFDVQVTSISYGSINFECLCLTPESAVRLQKEYDGKNLQAQFQRVISSLAILTDFGIKSIILAVGHKFADEVSAGMTSSSGSRQLFGPVDKEEVIESVESQLAKMNLASQNYPDITLTHPSSGDMEGIQVMVQPPNGQVHVARLGPAFMTYTNQAKLAAIARPRTKMPRDEKCPVGFILGAYGDERKELESRRQGTNPSSAVPAGTMGDGGTTYSGVNPNAVWLNSRGIWLSYVITVTILHLILLRIPFLNVAQAWTLTNVVHNIGNFIFLHMLKSTPWETNWGQGKSQLLTHWEQIDFGKQFTTTRKFLFLAPVILFLLASFYTKYDPLHFAVNLSTMLLVLIPKLRPQIHGVRTFGIKKYRRPSGNGGCLRYTPAEVSPVPSPVPSTGQTVCCRRLESPKIRRVYSDRTGHGWEIHT